MGREGGGGDGVGGRGTGGHALGWRGGILSGGSKRETTLQLFQSIEWPWDPRTRGIWGPGLRTVIDNIMTPCSTDYADVFIRSAHIRILPLIIGADQDH